MKFLCFATADDPAPRIGALEDAFVADLTALLADRRGESGSAPDPTAAMIAVLNRDRDSKGEIGAFVGDTLARGDGLAQEQITYLPPLADPGKFL